MSNGRLTDALIRDALRPPDDDAFRGLAASISEAVARTPQRRRGWAQILPLLWLPEASRAALRLALLVLLLLALVMALYLPGALRPRPSGSTMFHGNAARTGEVADVGPLSGDRLVWEVSLGGSVRNGMPALSGARLVVGDEQGFVGMYDVTDGALQWQVHLPRPATSPAVAGNIAIVGAGDGLYGLDLGSGATVWRIPSTAPVRAPPAVVEDVAFAGFPDGSVAALSVSTGEERWRVTVDESMKRGPAVANGTVFVPGGSGMFSAVSATTGAIEWQRRVGDGGLSTPAVVGDDLYVGTGLEEPSAWHRLLSLDPATGLEQWSFATDTGAELYVGAAVAESVYAVSLDGSVYALLDGAITWSRSTGAPIGSVATISGGLLYVSSSDGTVHVLDLSTGVERWTARVPGDPGPAVIGPGSMYVATDLGSLTAHADATPD